jgi:excisionase family DNA binding protein
MRKVITTEYSDEELTELVANAVERVMQKWQKEPQEPKYLSRKEAAKKLNISDVTLSAYKKQGKVKGYYLGGKMLFLESDLEAALVSIEPLKYRRG